MTIPKTAQKVFAGKIFDVYQWEQQMYDGSFQTFERLGRVDTVEVVATSKDQVYYALQSQPTQENFCGLFGGRMDPGEEPLDSARRELREEAGMESEDWELYKSYRPYNKIDWQVHVFIARDCRVVGEQKLDAGEQIEVQHASFEEFLEVMESERFVGKELLVDILKMRLHPERLEEFRTRIFSHR